MKKYVKANKFNYPYTGTGPRVNKRGGMIPFGKANEIKLPNGWEVHLASDKALVDANTGKVHVSLNFHVQLREPKRLLASIDFYSYTPEEFERLFEDMSTMSSDEMYEMAEELNANIYY